MKAPTEIILFDNNLEKKVDEAKEAARAAQRELFKQKLQKEYDDWGFIRNYVCQHMHILKGQKLPFEITSLQDIRDPYNCVIFNDMEMLPYQDVYDEIKLMEKRQEKLEEKKKMDDKECPKCGGALEDKPSVFHWKGESFAGLVCTECKARWDYDDSFAKYVAAFIKLEKEGRFNA